MNKDLKRKEFEEIQQLSPEDQLELINQVLESHQLKMKVTEGQYIEEIRSPYPPIEFLKGIEEIKSPLALGIIEDSRKAIQASTKMAQNESKANIKLKYLGSIGGFLIALLGIGGGIYLGSKGQDPSAIGSMLLGVGSVITSLRFIKKSS